MPKTKLMVVGHGRHGKDTVCEILERDWGYKWTSSSWAAAGIVHTQAVERVRRGEVTQRSISWRIAQQTVEEAFKDRHRDYNTRAYWYDTIARYNRDNPTALGRLIYSMADIYCGIRNPRELHALQRVKDLDLLTVWVDASKRLPPEPPTSMGIEPWMADHVIDNNHALCDLQQEVELFMAGVRQDERMKDAGF